MKTIKIKFYITVLLVAMLAVSCAAPITTKFSHNTVEIERGDSTQIFWEFSNAEFVRVSGFDGNFKTTDSLFVAPKSTTVYKVHAVDNIKKQLTISWKVVVVEPTVAKIDSNLLDKKFNEYHNNIAPSPNISRNEKINSISIVGSKSSNNNNRTLKFFTCDKNNEFVNEITLDENNLRIVAPNSKTVTLQITKIEEINNTSVAKNTDENNSINFCIALDNSATGVKNSDILTAIHSNSKNFPLNDNFYFSYFNQNFGGVMPIRRNNVSGGFDENFKRIPAPSGFAAINKSVGQAINYMVSQTVGTTVMIIITNSADNASILYDENDLAEHSIKNNIPIYVIAVGSSVPTFNLASLANRTGGKIYRLTGNEIGLLPHFLNEIVLSQKQHYSIDFTINNAPKNEDYLEIELILDGANNEIFKDSYSFPLQTQRIFSEYQVLASFKLGDTLLENDFLPAIKNLADVLISNPDLVVELIGNSGAIEGNDEICRRFGLRRAQVVRRKLIEEGANPVQIRVSTEGAARPLFQTPRLDWQFRYNNRVEIRWLLPEEYPFEIIADFSVSENAAQLNVESWENKNFKAYYQRIMRNNRPAYRTLLWGYSAEKEAEKVAKKLSREHRREFVLR